jgi:hypothetical protein
MDNNNDDDDIGVWRSNNESLSDLFHVFVDLQRKRLGSNFVLNFKLIFVGLY